MSRLGNLLGPVQPTAPVVLGARAPAPADTPPAPEALGRLVEQLWGPGMKRGLLRVGVATGPPEGWEVLHRFHLMPTPADPHLLVTVAPRQATLRALTAYAGLRSPMRRVARQATALLAAAGGVPGARSLVVAARPGSDEARAADPLNALSAATGARVIAVIGIRRGANAKPTLQLFTGAGHPLGYAKLAWNPLTAGMVRTEAAALGSLAQRPEQTTARAPRLVTRGQLNLRPYLMTDPLPRDITQLGGSRGLSADNLAGLFPVARWDIPARTGQVARTLGRLHRLAGLGDSAVTSEVIDTARCLGERLRRSTTMLPVAMRWHGDLVPWNAGRDREGITWLWDWESSEPDALAGMDILHWHLNATRPMSPHEAGGQLQKAAEAARPAMQALGTGLREQSLVTAAYALTLAERNATLAAAHGTWRHHRLPVTAVLDVLASAGALLEREVRAAQA